MKVIYTSPFVWFWSGYSLRNDLGRAKVEGSSCCWKSKCKTGPNVKETDTFQSSATKKVYKINHLFNCDSKCAIYLIFSKVCSLQYVGSSVERFHYKKLIESSQKLTLARGTPKQQYFHEHF